jgi:hypothetical protein
MNPPSVRQCCALLALLSAGGLAGCGLAPDTARQVYWHLWVAANGLEAPPPAFSDLDTDRTRVPEVRR